MAAVSLPCQICALNDYEEQCFNFFQKPGAENGLCRCGHFDNKHAMPVAQPAPAAAPQGMT
jgi:hypothetical protein